MSDRTEPAMLPEGDRVRMALAGGADLVLNDQRRAFSDEYVNLILATNKMYIELAARNPAAELPSVTVQELKNIPCILVVSREQQAAENGGDK